MNDMGIPPSELKNITFDGAADIIKRQHDPFTQVVLVVQGSALLCRIAAASEGVATMPTCVPDCSSR